MHGLSGALSFWLPALVVGRAVPGFSHGRFELRHPLGHHVEPPV